MSPSQREVPQLWQGGALGIRISIDQERKPTARSSKWSCGGPDLIGHREPRVVKAALEIRVGIGRLGKWEREYELWVLMREVVIVVVRIQLGSGQVARDRRPRQRTVGMTRGVSCELPATS